MPLQLLGAMVHNQVAIDAFAMPVVGHYLEPNNIEMEVIYLGTRPSTAQSGKLSEMETFIR
jgi:hypothetical protein